jgi:UPF0042 nucleotide-binding protein
MSGAGRSTALHALEDAGFEAVDNLPLSLLDALVAAPVRRPIAVGIDSRSRAFDPAALVARMAAMRGEGRDARLLFIDCGDAELVRRFSETRRRHPLAPDRPSTDGIARERELLLPVRQAADLLIDTSDRGPNDLRRLIAQMFAAGGEAAFTLTLMSFGYARGLPRDADLVFDMRFLRNPHWEPELRPLSGSDAAVRAFVETDPAWPEAFEALRALLVRLLPGYRQDGRAYLTVAFGCTGGRHRSVAVAEAISESLGAAGWANTVVHRDRGEAAEEAEPSAARRKEES